jgi:hypothetical protein
LPPRPGTRSIVPRGTLFPTTRRAG